MRRRIAAICVGLLLAGGIVYWLHTRNAISRALSQQMRHGPGTTVDFAEVARFAWDRVYVFGPYTPDEYIHSNLGFHWPGVTRSSIGWNEGVNLVVFVRGKAVVYWFEHLRHEELEGLANSKGYARDEARFTVCRVGFEQRLALAPHEQ